MGTMSMHPLDGLLTVYTGVFLDFGLVISN